MSEALDALRMSLPPLVAATLTGLVLSCVFFYVLNYAAKNLGNPAKNQSTVVLDFQRPQSWIFIGVPLSVIVGVVVLLQTQVPFYGLTGALMIGLLLQIGYSELSNRQSAAFERELPSVIRIWVSELPRAGNLQAAIGASLVQVSPETSRIIAPLANSDDLARDFRDRADDMRKLGRPSEGFGLLVAVMTAAVKQDNTQLVPALQQLATALDEIEKMKGEVRSATSKGMMSIRLIIAMSFVVMLSLSSAMPTELLGDVASTPISEVLTGVAFLMLPSAYMLATWMVRTKV